MTINHTSRFSYEQTGFFRSLFIGITSPFAKWEERTRGWVIDHETGERFKITKEEDAMILLLTDQMAEIASSYRVWTRERTDRAKDPVFKSFVDRRNGNAEEWNRFAVMTPDEWCDWLRETALND